MRDFLKVFLQGLICTILLPLILAFWVLYGVYCLFAFIIVAFVNLIIFFKGGDVNYVMEEDKIAKEKLAAQETAQENMNNLGQTMQTVMMQNAIQMQQMAQMMSQQVQAMNQNNTNPQTQQDQVFDVNSAENPAPIAEPAQLDLNDIPENNEEEEVGNND